MSGSLGLSACCWIRAQCGFQFPIPCHRHNKLLSFLAARCPNLLSLTLGVWSSNTPYFLHGTCPGKESTMKADDISSPHVAGVEVEQFPFGHPESWSSLRKWIYIALVSYCDCLTFVLTSVLFLKSYERGLTLPRFLMSMMLAPSVPQVLATFRPDGGDKSLGSFSVTVYILGFCIGPLLLAPLTDIYGRARLNCWLHNTHRGLRLVAESGNIDRIRILRRVLWRGSHGNRRCRHR